MPQPRSERSSARAVFLRPEINTLAAEATPTERRCLQLMLLPPPASQSAQMPANTGSLGFPVHCSDPFSAASSSPGPCTERCDVTQSVGMFCRVSSYEVWLICALQVEMWNCSPDSI